MELPALDMMRDEGVGVMGGWMGVGVVDGWVRE